MHLHWGCTSIYRPLSYPFRSLILRVYQATDTFMLCSYFNLLTTEQIKLPSLWKLHKEIQKALSYFNLDLNFDKV